MPLEDFQQLLAMTVVFLIDAKLDSIPNAHYSFHARETSYIISANKHWLTSLQL